MLFGKKPNSDKSGLSFDNFRTSTSHASNFDRKTFFVKHVKVEEFEANVACFNMGKKCMFE